MNMQLLDEKEKAILSALYANGQTTISTLAKLTLINRTTLYPILEKMKESGLVVSIRTEGTTYIEAISKKELTSWAKRREQDMKNASAELLQWVDTQAEEQQSLVVETKHFEGRKAVEALYGDTWRNNMEKMIYAITDYEAAYTTMGDFFRDEYFPRRVQHGVSVKSVLPNSPIGQQDKRSEKKLLRDMRIVDLFGDLGIEMNIYDDKIALIAFDEKKPSGVLIKNATIAKAMRAIFDELWSTGKKK
jgi:sugar-specific transcriptional regulator TrmB